MISGVFWNLFGTGFPLLVALWAVPHLLQGYGHDKFGLLSIIWALIGYFSIFDLGLGRALTKLVAERIGLKREQEIPDLVMTAMAVISVLGLSAGIIGVLSAEWLVGDLLKMSSDLALEGTAAMKVLSIGLPFVVLSAALIGLLEAHGEFKSVNLVRLMMGVGNFVGPTVSLSYSSSLVDATIILVVIRVLTTALYFQRCHKKKAFGTSVGHVDAALVRPLFQFGAWITVSNVISPLMVQLDRFVIGAVIGVVKLPFYVIPADMLNRLSFLPAALVNVLFPAFSKAMAHDRKHGAELFNKSCDLMLWCLAPIGIIICLYASDGLNLWMGEAFSSESAVIVKWLAIGFFFNGLARLPHALLQSSGRPDLTAKLHILEFPVYVAVMWLLLSEFNIVGAAIAWTFRMFLDMILLFFVAAQQVPEIRTRVLMNGINILVAAGLITIFMVWDGGGYRIYFATFAVLGAVLFCYKGIKRLRGAESV